MEQNRDRSSVAPSVAGVDALLIDLDGVVWVGGDPIPGSVGAIDQLRSHGVDVVFLTNDPRAAPDFYAAKLTEVGLPTATDEVITAGRAVAAFVARREGDGSPVFVIGSEGLHREVRAAGLTPCDPEAADEARAVVVGGHDDFHYAELRAAVRAVDAGATVYAAGRDATFPMPDGRWPATGAILAGSSTRPAYAVSRSASRIGSSSTWPGIGCRPIGGSAWSATTWTPTSPAAARRGSTRFWFSPAAPGRTTSSDLRSALTLSHRIWRPSPAWSSPIGTSRRPARSALLRHEICQEKANRVRNLD